MVCANKVRIDKYKSEYTIQLVEIYIRQKCILTQINIRTRMGNINGGNFRMNYTNMIHLVQLYDVWISHIVKEEDRPVIFHSNDISGGASRANKTSYSPIIIAG